MNALLLWILVSVLLLVIDIPWLWLNSSTFGDIVQGIQGTPLRFRLEAILVVYPALSYLLLKANSISEAILIGLATYSVYDFTTYSTFKNYPLSIAIGDTAWGGALFGIGYWMLKKFD